MKKTLSSNSRENTLESFCQESSSLPTKIALITFYKIQDPAWVSRLILIFEYLQLVSQAVLSTSFYSENAKYNIFFFEIVIYTLKLVNPCHLLLSHDSMTSTILVIVFCCALLKFLLFAKVIYVSARSQEINSSLLFLWRWIYRFQTRILYFLFTSFWVKTMIEAKQRDFMILGMSKHPLLTFGSLLIVTEFLFSLILETQLCYFLPTKNFLSAKNNQLQILTLSQKFFIQIASLMFTSNPEALNWIVPIVGIMIDIKRIYEFFFKFPLYHTKALILQGCLLALVFSSSLVNLMNIILKAADNKSASINFQIITWILLALLSNKISYEALKIKIISLLWTNQEEDNNVEMLLHKVQIIKEVQRNESIPTSETSNYAFSHLLSTYQNLNPFLESPGDSPHRVYFLYYQRLSKKFPKNTLIKLHYAHRSFKVQEPYPKVIKLAHEIQKRKRSPNLLGASLLLHDIEQSILNNQREKEISSQRLDFSTYIKSKLLVSNLKKLMLEQTALQIKICDNMLNDVCNIEDIHSSAQKISELKRIIQRKIDKLSEAFPEHYISPFLFYAEYHIVVNQSTDYFIKCYEAYTQKRYKTRSFFHEQNLMEENLYQDSNALILISTHKTEFGRILYASKALDNLCSGKKAQPLTQGLNISILFPPFLKEYYENIFKQSQLPNLVDKVHHAYLSNKGGHLVEVNFCVKYHPFLAHGLCLNMIIRPVPVSKNTEFLLLAKESHIEGASKGLTKLLRLQESPSTPVKDISEELYQMNKAFNKILKKDTKTPQTNWTLSRLDLGLDSNIGYAKAQEIYAAWTTESQEIQLSLPNKKSKNPEDLDWLKFHSQVRVINYGDDIQYKVVILNQIHSATTKLLATERTHRISVPETLPTDYDQPQITITAPDNAPLTTERKHLVIDTLASDVSQYESPDHFRRRRRRRRNDTHFQTLILETDFLETEPNHLETSVHRKQEIQTYANTYVSSQNSIRVKQAEKAENKIYRLAILSKSYPKSFTSLCLIFYFIILITFTTQIIMKSISDSTMEDLQIRKNLLKYSEEKTYRGALIQLHSRGIELELSKLIVQTGQGTYENVTSSVPNLQIHLHDMKIASDNMLKQAYSLDIETQKELFREDVMINGSHLDLEDQSYKYVNIFQVTDLVGNAIKTLAGLPDPSTITGYRIAYFLLVNLANDFLYKSAQITETLKKTVESQKQSFESITYLFLTLNPFLLTGIGLLLVAIIWNQYQIEKENMRAFVKLPREGIEIITDRFHQFQENLHNDENFERKWLSVVNKDLRGFQKNQNHSAYSRRSETQKIQYKTFRQRYHKYIIRVVACISVLVAITIWDLVSTTHDIKVIYNQQNQLQFANYISNRAIVAHMTRVELVFANNTLKVEHRDAFEGLVSIIKVIKQIQSEISQKFLEVDGDYNPEVRDIIYKDNPECKNLPTFGRYCKILVATGRPVSMAVLIGALQSLAELKVAEFLKVDRSNMTKIQQSAYWTETTLTFSVVIAEEAHNIADIMDKSITQKISDMQSQKITIITIFSIGLFFVSILTWLYILQVIREVYNDFKKVLQTFPPNLVLSSYLLKRFLQTTSSGLLFKDIQ